jgi:hypothetical protein
LFKINLSTFQHDLGLTTLIRDFYNELNIHFLTEREKKQLSDEFKHIPDAFHIAPTNEYIIVDQVVFKFFLMQYSPLFFHQYLNI